MGVEGIRPSGQPPTLPANAVAAAAGAALGAGKVAGPGAATKAAASTSAKTPWVDHFVRRTKNFFVRFQQNPPGGPTLQAANAGPAKTFTQEGPKALSATPASGSPEEAAELVQRQQNGFGDTGAVQANLFTQHLSEHKDDARWLQGYFQALGTDKSAELLSGAVKPENYRDWDPRDVNARIDGTRAALTTLYQAGKLTQGDMDNLMSHWTGDVDSQAFRGLVGGGNRVNSGLAQLFAGGAVPEGLKNEFFQSAVGASQNSELAAEERNDVAAAGAYVLSSTSMDNQVVQLRDLQASGKDKIGDFVSRAMSGEKTVPTLLNSAFNDRDPSTGNFRHPIEERYDGMARVLFNLGYADTGLRDPFQGAAPFSQAELSKVRQEAFVSAAKAMHAHAGTWDDNTLLKDGLSRIFRQEFDNLWKGNLAGNSASLANGTVQEAFESFFQHVLFTQPGGAQRDMTSQFLADKMRGWVDDIRTLSDTDFQAKYGLDKTQLSKIAGETLGHLSNGMEKAVDSAKDRKAAQEAVIKTAVDLAFSMLPPGGPLKGVLGETGVKALDALFGKIDGDLRDRLKTATIDQAKSILSKELPGFNFDAPLAKLANDLSDVIPETNDRNYLSAFQSAFSFIDRDYAPKK